MPSNCRVCGLPLASDHALYCSHCGAPTARYAQVPVFTPLMRFLAYLLGAALLVLAMMLAVDATCAPFMSLPGMPGSHNVGHRMHVELVLLMIAAAGLVALAFVALFGRRE